MSAPSKCVTFPTLIPNFVGNLTSSDFFFPQQNTPHFNRLAAEAKVKHMEKAGYRVKTPTNPSDRGLQFFEHFRTFSIKTGSFMLINQLGREGWGDHNLLLLIKNKLKIALL